MSCLKSMILLWVVVGFCCGWWSDFVVGGGRFCCAVKVGIFRILAGIEDSDYWTPQKSPEECAPVHVDQSN